MLQKPAINLHRVKLSEKERTFLEALIPWSWMVENQTAYKALVYRNFAGAYGLSSILFTCMVLRETNWGSHPLAQEQFKGKDSCNLLLQKPNEFWEGRVVKYDGEDYKLFDSYEDFCIAYTDHVVFSELYDYVILEKDYLKQLEILTRDDSRAYNEIIKILSLLGLKNGQ